MSRSQHQQMRDAINDVELALNGLEIDSVVRLFETADDSVMVKVPLGALRQLGRCYPVLNRIINDPAFERSPRLPEATGGVLDWSEALTERVLQLKNAGCSSLSCTQVIGLINFVRDGQGLSAEQSGGAVVDKEPESR